jgi:hypothetical protein
VVREEMAVQMTVNNKNASQRKLQEKVYFPAIIFLHQPHCHPYWQEILPLFL